MECSKHVQWNLFLQNASREFYRYEEDVVVKITPSLAWI